VTTIDFAKALRDAKGASYEALPSGDYDVEVAQADATRASSGKPMIKAQMSVLFGPHQGRRVFNNFVLSLENPQAVAIFFRHMRSFGLTDEFFASLGTASGLEPVASALQGRRARLTLGQREWNGEPRNEVNAVKPYTGAPAVAGPGSHPAGPGAGPGAAAPPPLATPPVAPPAPPVAPSAPPPVAQPAPVAPAPPTLPQAPVTPPSPAPATPVGPVIEAAPFDGTPGPAAVPTAATTAAGGATDAGSTPSSTDAPTQPTSSSPPPPPAAPELPF
jgi:hypothetical protein